MTSTQWKVSVYNLMGEACCIHVVSKLICPAMNDIKVHLCHVAMVRIVHHIAKIDIYNIQLTYEGSGFTYKGKHALMRELSWRYEGFKIVQHNLQIFAGTLVHSP